MKFRKLISSDRFKNTVKKYISGLIVYGFSVLFIYLFPFYRGYLAVQTFDVLKYLFLGYVVFGFFACYVDSDKKSKPLELLSILNKLPDIIYDYSFSFLRKNHKHKGMSEREKLILRFFLLKFFYIPLMLSFTIGNLSNINGWLSGVNIRKILTDFSINYGLITQLFFAIDTFVFCFGYIFESKYLRNTLRSVEPTMLGWIVALITYPPFNGTTMQVLGWYSNENFKMVDPVVDVLLKIMIVIFIGVYLWATLSLGAKASNLTNRGIVSNGAYKIVRHPAYSAKIIAWWIMIIPNISLNAIISIFGWTIIYYLRAITEERHLIVDLDYQKYIKKTRFRFIPGVI